MQPGKIIHFCSLLLPLSITSYMPVIFGLVFLSLPQFVTIGCNSPPLLYCFYCVSSSPFPFYSGRLPYFPVFRSLAVLLFSITHQATKSLIKVKSRRMSWAGLLAHVGEGRGVHRFLVGKPEGKRPLGRLRRRWEDNIKMDLRK